MHSARSLLTVLLGLALASRGLAGEAEGPPQAGEGGGNPPPAAIFEIEEAAALPGESVLVGLLVRSQGPLAMVSWSFEFDPSALEFAGVELSGEVQAFLDLVPAFDSRLDVYSEPEEGWAQASLVADYQARVGFSLPPQSGPIGRLRFVVRSDAPPGPHAITLTRAQGARYAGNFRSPAGSVYNVVRGPGRPFAPGDEFAGSTDAEALEDGEVRVGIIGDVGIFVRGDANLDLRVDVSDPVRILNTLFLGAEPLGCEQAADANQDRRLDLSDPVTLLNHLFLESSGFSPSLFIAESEAGGLTCPLSYPTAE